MPTLVFNEDAPVLFEMSIVDLSPGLGEGLAALAALVRHLILGGVDVPG